MALPIRQTKQKPIRQTKPETEVIDRARPNGILGSMLYKPTEVRSLNADNLEQIAESNPEAVQEALPNTPIAEEARQITNDSDARNDEVSNNAVESTIEQFNSPYDDISDETANNLDEITANDPDVNAGGKFDINAIANQDAQLMSQIFNIPIPQEEAKPAEQAEQVAEETVDEEIAEEETPEDADNKKSTLADMLSAINVGGAVSGGSISKAPVSGVSATVPTSNSTNAKSSTISGSSIGGNNIAKSISSPSVSASANTSSTKPYSPIVNKSYNKAGTINSPKLQNKAISAESAVGVAGHNEIKSSVTNGTFGSGSRTKSKTLSVRNNDIPQEDETHTASYSNNNITNTDIQNAMISNNIREHIIRASRTWILDDYGFRNSGSKLDPITIRVKGAEIIVNGNGIRNKPFDSLNNNELKLLSSYI